MKLILFLTVTWCLEGWSSSSNLADKLVELREAIQQEADSLEGQKNTLKSSIQTLTMEKSEAKIDLGRIRSQNKEWQKLWMSKSEILKGKGVKDHKILSQEVESTLAQLSRKVQNQIPFKVKKRQKKINKLIKNYKDEKITLAQYYERHWSLMQDELRLSESTEVHFDEILLEGSLTRVKLLKLGMVSLYFETPKNKIGVFKKQNNIWTPYLLQDPQSEKKVKALFRSKEKNIKGGKFDLPVFASRKESDHV